MLETVWIRVDGGNGFELVALELAEYTLLSLLANPDGDALKH